MKKIVHIALLMGCIIFHSCSSETNKPQEIQKFYVNLKEETNDMNELCQKMDIRLMPMETMDSCIFNDESSSLYPVDDYYFVVDQSQKTIFRFDKNGHFKNLLNKVGQGDKEYKTILEAKISNGSIYIKDYERMQVYNYEGQFLKSIPLDGFIDDLIVVGQRFYVRQDYSNEYQLLVLDENSNVVDKYFPSREVLRGFFVPKANYHILGSYDNGIYVANPMDYNIYLLKDTVSVLAQLDFGAMNLPSDFFDGDSQQVEAKFNDARSTNNSPIPITKSITMIQNLIVTDDWMTFVPESFDPSVVYCNRKTGKSFTNKGLKDPYATFFKGYKCPSGYNPTTGEFYMLVNSMALKETIESLRESEGNDYEQKYPFLKGIDPEKIKDETNAYMLFFKMKA